MRTRWVPNLTLVSWIDLYRLFRSARAFKPADVGTGGGREEGTGPLGSNITFFKVSLTEVVETGENTESGEAAENAETGEAAEASELSLSDS